MLRLARLLQFGGAFLVAAWLGTAHAQDDYSAVVASNHNDEELTEPSRSESSELRPNMKSPVSSGYVQGPTCGCSAHAAPSCGCQGGCGAEVGCGCTAACCCEDDCCGCCIPGCSCGWYGGGEVVWMKPYWSTMTALEVESPTVGGVFNSHHQGYDYDFDPTARFFVGYTGCNGLGVRASWWEFDHDSAVETATVAPGGVVNTSFLSSRNPGDVITTQQRLELQTIDLEFTSCFQACGGDMVVGFGVRYAKFNLDIHEQLLGGIVVGADPESFDMTQKFEGLGPTVSLEFIRPLCFSGLSFYSSLRGSVVFGKLHERDRDVGDFGRGVFDDRHTFDTDKAQAIADVQVALQYCRCGWFARGGWQAQYWDTVAHTDNDDFDASRASLGLSGFFVAVGGQR